jgi:uncharacterized protein (DUF1015 family)
VLAPPYDVLSSAEARARCVGRGDDFLHVSKAEIDFAPNQDPYAPVVYARAAANFAGLIERGVLRRDARPGYYVYALEQAGHRQLGVGLTASVAAYDRQRIRRHEFTRPDKEDDRVRHIEATGAQTGPVLLVYPSAARIDAIAAECAAGAPLAEAQLEGGVAHRLWRIDETQLIAELTAAFEALPSLYIADGHHRTAAASRVAARRGGEAAGGFLAVAFPHHAMRILAYHRVVRDLNGWSASELLHRVAERFDLQASEAPHTPRQRGEFGLYLDGGWQRLRIRPERVRQDAVGRLDVSLLGEHLLAHVFGITDQRRDPRIDFVGGARGLSELERRVDTGDMACAIALYPTAMEDLMAVSDAGQVMPPKSTWFEPKLADGLLCHLLDD